MRTYGERRAAFDGLTRTTGTSACRRIMWRICRGLRTEPNTPGRRMVRITMTYRKWGLETAESRCKKAVIDESMYLHFSASPRLREKIASAFYSFRNTPALQSPPLPDPYICISPRLRGSAGIASAFSSSRNTPALQSPPLLDPCICISPRLRGQIASVFSAARTSPTVTCS